MKKNQYYPFDDFEQITISGHGPDMEELPWREVAKRMRETPLEKNSETLEHLVNVFRDEIKKHGEEKALDAFWKEVDKLRGRSILTGEMSEVLHSAKDGNIKSAQVMVRAAPITTYLPFIARSVRYVIAQYKYCDSTGGLLKDVKDSWINFLPTRTGGGITYNDVDLQKIFDLAKKQMQGEKKLDRKGKKVPLSNTNIREAVAEALHLSDEYLRKHIKLK